jgi:hypothetical protein
MSEGGQGQRPAAAADLAADLPADAGLAALQNDYERCTLEALARMSQALATARADATARAAALRQLFEAAHDVKGQGASFGYPLLSRIGQSLCRIGHSAAHDSFSPEALKVVAAHVEAMKVILDKRIRGDGGTLGARLAEKLEAMPV